MNDSIKVGELLVEGWVFGVMTCMLYAVSANYCTIKRRNRRHQDLLDAGVDPITILNMDD